MFSCLFQDSVRSAGEKALSSLSRAAIKNCGSESALGSKQKSVVVSKLIPVLVENGLTSKLKFISETRFFLSSHLLHYLYFSFWMFFSWQTKPPAYYGRQKNRSFAFRINFFTTHPLIKTLNRRFLPIFQNFCLKKCFDPRN